MTVPHWRRRSDAVLAEVDAAVIGAGITGVGAALAFERAGLSVALFDRQTLASGASGRNAGFLMRGAADNYILAARSLGRDRARALWKLTEDNLRDLRAAGIESLPTCQRVTSCIIATEEGEAQELRDSARLMAEDGFDVELVSRGQDSLWRSGIAKIGLVNPGDSACNPHELLAYLRSKLNTQPCENCEIFALEQDDHRAVVRFADGVVLAKRALVCTNAYTDLLLSRFTGRITPNRGQMLALAAPRRMLDCSYYLNHGADYLRQSDDQTIVIGGRRKLREAQERTRDDSTTEEIQSALELHAAALLGERLPVLARWAGTMGFTQSGLPLVGPLHASRATDRSEQQSMTDSRLWLCAGFNGHGMSMAFRTAGLTVRTMLGDAEAAQELAPVCEPPTEP